MNEGVIAIHDKYCFIAKTVQFQSKIICHHVQFITRYVY